MQGPQSYIRALVWLLIFIAADARVLDARDVVVGDWDVEIKCGRDFYTSVLFPSTYRKMSAAEFDPSKILTSGRLFGVSQNFPCQLSIFPNGTFALRPSTFEPTRRQYQRKRDTVDEMAILPTILGQWEVNANPYCITDRFYDQLHLKPYQRLLIARQVPEERSASKEEKHPPLWSRIRRKREDANDLLWQQKVCLNIHCRVGGRYASPGIWKKLPLFSWRGANQSSKTRVRLTHGLLLWHSSKISAEGLDDIRTSTKRQNIGASLSGEKIVQRAEISKYDAEEELQMFGY